MPLRPTGRLGAAAGLAIAVLAAACGEAPPAPDPSPSPVATTPAPAPGSPTATPDPSEPVATLPPGDPALLTVTLEAVVAGLASPVGFAAPDDGTGRLMILEQAGRVLVVENGQLLAEPFLDLTDRVGCCGERGLLGLAFHPAFPTDPRFFVDYIDRSGGTVVAEVRVDPEIPERADPASLREVLRVDQPFGNHNGGLVAFGPDGFLYVGLGDGGSAGDPHDNGQRLDTLLGAILRLDIDRSEGGRGYAIPADNPFVGRAGARAEIAHYGLRNPWQFSFDRATGDLWIGDVGQDRYEEISVARAGQLGLNFGWKLMEGFHCYPSGEGCARPELTLPVAEYDHDVGCSVIGGAVYRGSGQPAMAGLYLFVDNCSGTIWALDPVGDEPKTLSVAGAMDGRPSAFGQDAAGELYLLDRTGGRLLRIVAGTSG